MVSFTLFNKAISKTPRRLLSINLEPLKSFDNYVNKKSQTFYSSISEKFCIDSQGNRSESVLNPYLLKDSDHLLLANSRFYCQDKPLLGINKDGSLNHWPLLPHLSIDQFDPKSAFTVKPLDEQIPEEASEFSEDLNSEVTFQYLSPNSLPYNSETSDIFHPLISRFNGDASLATNNFFDKVLENLGSSPRLFASRSSIRRGRSRALRPVIYATSVLRKRRAKMNKHKYEKFRKRTRALRKRLNK